MTDACSIFSDVDIYVEGTNENIKLSGCHEYDIWTNHPVDNKLIEETNTKGVVVYQKKIFALANIF